MFNDCDGITTEFLRREREAKEQSELRNNAYQILEYLEELNSKMEKLNNRVDKILDKLNSL